MFPIGVADENAKTSLVHCLPLPAQSLTCSLWPCQNNLGGSQTRAALTSAVLYFEKSINAQTRSPLSGFPPVTRSEKSFRNEIKNCFTACLDAPPRTQFHAMQ